MPDNNKATSKRTLALPVETIEELERRAALRNLNRDSKQLQLPGVERWRSCTWQDLLRAGLAQWIEETAPAWKKSAVGPRRAPKKRAKGARRGR